MKPFQSTRTTEQIEAALLIASYLRSFKVDSVGALSVKCMILRSSLVDLMGSDMWPENAVTLNKKNLTRCCDETQTSEKNLSSYKNR